MSYLKCSTVLAQNMIKVDFAVRSNFHLEHHVDVVPQPSKLPLFSEGKEFLNQDTTKIPL